MLSNSVQFKNVQYGFFSNSFSNLWMAKLSNLKEIDYFLAVSCAISPADFLVRFWKL